MVDQQVTQAIGRLRGEIRRYLCKETGYDTLSRFLRDLGLDIDLRPSGEYTLRLSAPNGTLTPAQDQVLAEMPKVHAVDPPQRTAGAILITGFDVECLPAMMVELTEARLFELRPADFL